MYTVMDTDPRRSFSRRSLTGVLAGRVIRRAGRRVWWMVWRSKVVGPVSSLIAGLILLGTEVSAAAVPPESGFAAVPEPEHQAALYDGPIIFDVIRKGKKIGEHVTRFEPADDGLLVVNDLDLKVKVLFITAFKLDYHSEAVWDESGLKLLETKVKQGRKRRVLEGLRDGDIFSWTTPKGESLSADNPETLYPTDHWHVGVVDQHQVLNTLTGAMDDVNIRPVQWESVPTGTGPRRALKYQYEGDLDNQVWYDEAGRWVGLQFKGKDGSTVRYVCRQCGKDG